MRTADTIPAAVRRLQTEAANPRVSAWVGANAGAGKTHVLAQRVVNLLLHGVEPEKILCLTYTKAAAANMAARVFDTLAAWTRLDDRALDDAIRERSDMAPDAVRRSQARRLFARALETPGGLKVQTIHAFCTQALHRFPFEAGVAAGFSVLDEAEQTQLLEQLTLAVLLDGAANPGGELGRALAVAMTAAADQTFRELVRQAVGERETIVSWVRRAGGVAAAIDELSRALSLDAADSRDGIEAQIFSDSPIKPQDWSAIAAVLANGGKTDAGQARRFAALRSLAGADRVDMYAEIFCTVQGTPRRSIVSKAIKDADLIARLQAEQGRVCALLRRLCAVKCRDRSAALLTVSHEVLDRYSKEKQRRGLLDYDDLIDNTLDLLRNYGAAWVHYKLDLGIDHLLIDEAQDTSSKQWEIVVRLTEEFMAGAGARTVTRTIFAVGDEKQSIYSFQKAAPREFADMRRHYQRAHEAVGLPFVHCEFKHSFRSGNSVLGAVDEVFKNPEIAASVTSDAGGFPPHLALPDAPPGTVEIWEPETPDERVAIEGWDAPFDQVSETNSRVKLARRIARAVRRMAESGCGAGGNQRLRYGDILILVRQRGELFEAIIRALKIENVAVAGADRLVLAEHIAVMDLMALADAVLLPQDDLALATVLRSPLFGFSDDDLFDVAWERRGSLRAALSGKAGERQKFAEAARYLDELAEMARQRTPFAFFAHVLGAGGGRRRFWTRLGAEANDALDEFLNLALDYERRQTPSLQGFLAWLRAARAEIKRDMEMARNEVRVMTVHGAKGLEAPVVILADTMTDPTGPRPPRLLQLAGGALIWAGRKNDDGPVEAAARATALAGALDEYRRLLYVAMTRAAHRLIVCGAEGSRKRPAGCWYDLVREALQPYLLEEDDSGDRVWTYRKPATAAAKLQQAAAPEAAPLPREIPRWLWQPSPAPVRRPPPLSPSAAFDEEPPDRSAADASALDRRAALERGRLVHRLLQSLPAIAPERRRDAAVRFLARAATTVSAQEQSEIVSKVLAVLDDAGFARIFAPGSRAEVPIVGRLPRPDGGTETISGQVDRLVVTGAAVLIVDFKSDRSVPDALEDVEAYIVQLGLYRAVLSRVFPDKPVRAALVFTQEPRLVEPSATAMEQAVARALGRRGHRLVKVP